MTRRHPYLIAEIGVNHDGSVDRAREMIRDAASAGFDAIKLQHWLVAELLAPIAPRAPYQGEGDQAELLQGLALDVDGLRALREASEGFGVDFIVTADGVHALAEVLTVGVDALKIGSGDADNPWLLDAAVEARVPLVVSLGMTSDDDVRRIAARLAPVDDLTFLHCVSAYPTALREASLGRLAQLRELTGRAVGFSDHTIGVAAAAAAVALDATMIEKHVTWSTTAPGADHAMSLALVDAPEWVEQVRGVAHAVSEATSSADEQANKAVVRKALYTTRALEAGSVVGPDDVVGLRPLDDGIPVSQRDVVIGSTVVRRIEAGERLRPDDVRAG